MNKKVGFYGGKFLPLHNGHIYSILYSARKCDELHVFLFYNTFEEKKKIEESVFPKKLLTPQPTIFITSLDSESHLIILLSLVLLKHFSESIE